MAGRQQIYESYIDLLMRMHQQEPEKGYAGTALQFSERARARSLLDLMAEARAQIRQGVDPALLEKERSLLERLNAKDAAWRKFKGNERTKGAADSVANEINDLTTQLQSGRSADSFLQPALCRIDSTAIADPVGYSTTGDR